MIRNIITPASNSGERAILRRAQKHSVTTGGWVREVHDQKSGVRTRQYTGQAKSDLDNLRVADLTVLIVVGDPRPAGQKRLERILKKSHCRSVIRVSLDSERASIVRECQSLGVEVLCFVCIQNPGDECGADQRVESFVDDFLEEAGDLVTKMAPAIWHNEARFKPFRKRRLPPGPVAEFNRTNDRRFLPGVESKAQDEIFSLVAGLPIDRSLVRQIVGEANSKFAKELNDLAGGNPRGDWFNPLWQRCAVDAVQTQVAGLPPRRKANIELLTRHFYDRGQHRELPAPVGCEFFSMCEIAAQTSLRPERSLRTLAIMQLGGISRDKNASRIVNRCIKAHERTNHDFSRDQLDQRFQKVGGWQAVLAAGNASRNDRNDDPFWQFAKNRRNILEAELFYAADEFRQRREFWRAEWVAAFCRSLSYLCGQNESLWRSWIGPPVPAT